MIAITGQGEGMAKAGGLDAAALLDPGLPGRCGGRLKLVYGAAADAWTGIGAETGGLTGAETGAETDTGGRIETLDDAGRVTGRMAMARLVQALPCFTPDTAIATAEGPRQAGTLRPGDRIATRDHGLCPIAWIGRRDFDWRMLGLNPILRPVRIRAGALGQGLPERDLLLSPNHRLLVSARPDPDRAATEALVAAAALVGRPGIGRDTPGAVSYLQILFARHEAVLAEGCWSESYQPDRHSLAALDPGARRALDQALPGLGADDSQGFAAVRDTVPAEAVAALTC